MNDFKLNVVVSAENQEEAHRILRLILGRGIGATRHMNRTFDNIPKWEQVPTNVLIRHEDSDECSVAFSGV